MLRRSHSAALALLLAGGAPLAARAQLPTLHGVTLFAADAAGNNDLAPGHQFRAAWRSNPGVFLQYHNVFLAGAPDAAFAGVYPNGAPDFLQQTLSAGTNTFYFYADGTDRGNPGQLWGLNLWFGSGPQSACTDAPDISAVVAPGGATPAAAATGATTATQCSPPAQNWIPGAGTLTTTVGQYRVTLTDFDFLVAGDQPGAPDRVSATAAGANGLGDSYGAFTLDVVAINAVPEPATWTLLGAGLLGLVGLAGTRRRRGAR